MNIIKNKNMKYFYVGIIIVLIFFLTTIKTKGQEQYQEPYTFDFENNAILDIDQENNPNYYNIRNQTEYLGNYESAFSFENDLENDIPKGFNTSNDPLASTTVLDYYAGHNKVLLASVVTSNNFWISKEFSEVKPSGICEFSFYTLHNDRTIFFGLAWSELNNDWSIILRQTAGQLYYYDSGYISIASIDNYEWYHVAVQWYINYTFDIYLNGQLLATDLGFDDSEYPSYFEFKSNTFSGNYYLDALDFSWSNNYQFLRSLIPITESTGILEVDKYEFDYDYDVFEADLTDWIQTEKDVSTNQINIGGSKDVDKFIAFDMFYGSIYSQKLDYIPNSNSMILNISINLNPVSLTPYDFKVYFVMKPYNRLNSTHKIAFLIDDNTDTFKVFNQTLDDYEILCYITQNQELDINIYINSYDDIYIFRVNNGSGIYSKTYLYDVDSLDFYGFYEMFFYGSCNEVSNPSGMNTTIKNVGIYQNSLSIINETDNYEFGLMYYEIDDSWNSDSHNLLTIDSNNYYDTYVYNYYDYYLDGYLIDDKYNQTELRTINLQDSLDNNYPKFIYANPYLIFKIFGNCTNFYEIEIEGIRLIDQDNNYVYGNYYYNASNPLENWFYAIDNKLYYNFNDTNEYVKETMRITFNINDILLINESLISYSSYLTNNYSGYIYLSSYYFTEVFDISNNDTLTNSYVNITDLEHFTLKEISIEISSNDISSGLAKGYIQNLNIYPTKPLFPDFEPIEYLESTFLEKMIETIIPLLFFIIPSFIMKTKFGNKAVLPIWILLTLIFIIANFIPFWIGFIIFLSIGLMALNKDEVMD